MALLYFILVIIIMNSIKTVWGRMRFREMTDPINEFTRWYQIVSRGGFNNIYASFLSGHSMNSAGVILVVHEMLGINDSREEPMVEAMMRGLPLKSLVSFGIMQPEQVDQLIHTMNGQIQG